MLVKFNAIKLNGVPVSSLISHEVDINFSNSFVVTDEVSWQSLVSPSVLNVNTSASPTQLMTFDVPVSTGGISTSIGSVDAPVGFTPSVTLAYEAATAQSTNSQFIVSSDATSSFGMSVDAFVAIIIQMGGVSYGTSVETNNTFAQTVSCATQSIFGTPLFDMEAIASVVTSASITADDKTSCAVVVPLSTIMSLGDIGASRFRRTQTSISTTVDVANIDNVTDAVVNASVGTVNSALLSGLKRDLSAVITLDVSNGATVGTLRTSVVTTDVTVSNSLSTHAVTAIVAEVERIVSTISERLQINSPITVTVSITSSGDGVTEIESPIQLENIESD